MFTGQGSIKEPGIWNGLMQSPKGREIFRMTEELSGPGFSSLVSEGSLEELMQTKNAQPAIIACDLASLAAFKEYQPEVSSQKFAYLGHSAGEIAALTAAGVFDEATGIYLSYRRGLIMQEYAPEGAMAAVMTEDEKVTALLNEVNVGVKNPADIVEAVNLNGPRQTVVSGKGERIQLLTEMARQSRIVAKLLPVPNPFHHSVLMKEAQDKFADVLDSTEFRIPKGPVILNKTGRAALSAETIKAELSQQIASPVRWRDSIEWLLENGVTSFAEFGPQPVLTGLLRGINREAAAIWIGDCQSAKDLKF